MKRLIKWFNQHRKEAIAIVVIALISLVLRLYKIDQYLTFLGDEGRDVRIVRDLVTKGNLVFIGPQTSIGNMYLGPIYYYMMAPFLWLFNLSPVGPAVMIALLSTLTIVFVWWVGRSWFTPLTGLIAALLFAISPVAIIYGRASWNPNPMPFFALLGVWSIYQLAKTKHHAWLYLASASIAAALQMHYLGLLLLPTLGLFWLIYLKNNWQDKKVRSNFLLTTLLAFFLFLALMSPLVLFDIKHNGQNLNAFKAFFSDRQTTVNANPLRSDRFFPIIVSLTESLVLFNSTTYSSIFAVLVIISLVLLTIKYRRLRPTIFLLLAWIGFGWLGLSIYKQHVYAHYFGFLFPAFYLFLGLLISTLLESKNFTKYLGGVILIYLLYLAFTFSPLKFSPNSQLQRTEKAVDLIIKESNGQEFNFGLIAKQNYDESYRYFLENKQAKMIRGEDKVTDQLFVICEDGDKCQPEGNPGYQIAIFGPSHVVNQWQIDHLKIYRLEHSK